MMKSVIAACMLLSALTPLQARGELVSGIVAVVNDDIVTTLDLDHEILQMARESGKRDPLTPAERAKLKPAAVNRIVDRKLVDQKIKELDIKISEEEVRQSIEEVKKQNNFTQERLVEALAGQGLSFDQYKSQLREQLERLRLMSQEVKAKVQVGVKEMMEYYQANRTKYGETELFKARHILLKIPKDAGEADIEKIRIKAGQIVKEARDGGDFAELAKKYSEDPNVANDSGELGSFKKGDLLPEMEEVVLKLNQGDVSEPVQTKGALHIIKLEKRYQGNIKPFDEVKGEIEETLYKAKSEERFKIWVTELRKNAAIEIR
jgi:peptidyl-prolyl cis-trans isomerase SurA